jgi:polysaccharide export outer membrane protein
MVRFCGIFLLSTVLSLGAGKPEQPPKELVSYIQEAKKLGLNDAEIRRRAAGAGWSAGIVDEAFVTLEHPAHVSSPDSTSVDVPDGYRIGAGDVLQVSVWREPDASVPSATVRGDGKISIPLIKEVEVLGLTPVEAEKVISTKLSRYIHGADVTVIIREIHSRKAYLVGGVRSVGAIQLKGNVTVLQAITEAGGLSDYAKRKSIYVLRTENGKQIKLPFNYEAVIRGEDMGQNIVLSPNDMIVVPQ